MLHDIFTAFDWGVEAELSFDVYLICFCEAIHRFYDEILGFIADGDTTDDGHRIDGIVFNVAQILFHALKSFLYYVLFHSVKVLRKTR